ncbi:MAG: SpoIIE family protein phosphatase [Limnochordia bacterium]
MSYSKRGIGLLIVCLLLFWVGANPVATALEKKDLVPGVGESRPPVAWFLLGLLIAIKLGVILRFVKSIGGQRAAEGKYRALLQAIVEGFAVFQVGNDDYRLVECNDSFRRLFPEVANSLGQSPQEFLPSWPVLWHRLFSEVVRTGRPQEIKEPIEHRGRIISAQAYRPQDDHVALIISDITEEVQVHQALQQEKQFFEDIFEATSLGYWDWDLTTDNQYLSPRCRQLCGYGDQEVINWLDLVLPEDGQLVQSQLDRHFRSRGVEPFSCEIRLRHGQGPLVWVMAAGRVTNWDEEMGPLRMVGCLLDITKQKLFEESLQRHYRAEKLIAEVSGIFVRRHFEQGLIDKALEHIGHFFGAQGVYLYQVEGERLQIIHAFPRSAIGFLPGSAPWWVDEVFEQPQVFLNPQGHGGTLLVIPIHANQDPLGYLVLEHQGKERKWSRDEINLTRTVSEIIVGALNRERAEAKINEYAMELELRGLELEELYRKLDDEFAKARHIHDTIIPKTLPQVPGMALAAHYRPAGNIGGDFYNVIQKGNQLILYLSDVTGHGLDGAMLSSFVKHTIDTLIMATGESSLTPALIGRALAQRMAAEDFPPDYAVTIFIGMIDLDTNQMVYTGAGFHTPPLLSRRDEDVQTLDTPGLPITTSVSMDLISLEEQILQLKPGDTLLLATDGLYEQRQGSCLYGQRLLPLFQRNSPLPAQVLLDLIINDFEEFLGPREQTDDVSLLVMKLGREGIFTGDWPSSLGALEELR